ncbi:MAG TPA: SBBP repeat-containing protein [Verrucomicrobiae bacterium]|nr:SBBP repeat-containing protein [Verrucomicrobiae bacterium]
MKLSLLLSAALRTFGPGVRLWHRRKLTTAPVWILACVAQTAYPVRAASFQPVAAARPSTVSLAPGPELFFEPGPSQPGGGNQFLARGRNFRFLINPERMDFTLVRRLPPDISAPKGRQQLAMGAPAATATGRMVFLGANSRAVVRGESELNGRINYLVGDSSDWRTGLSAYSKVRIDDIYPGIGLVYYGNRRELEYDFTVEPGADPKAIVIRFEGVDKVALGESGDLRLDIQGSKVSQAKPVLYQMEGASRVYVPGEYVIKSTNEVAFSVGPYDQRRPLIIDPVFVYSTYFGGNGADLGLSVKVDSAGSVYIAGQTLSAQFPITLPAGAAQRHLGGGVFNGDAFVAKFDNTGNNLIYFTYLGGNGEDGALDLAVGPAGNAYLAGFTQSTNFPVWKALSPKLHGVPDPVIGLFSPDGFVAELNTNGSAVVFSTFLGGTNSDIADGIALDGGQNICVTGLTGSPDFPTRNPIPGLTNFEGGQFDAFVTKISADGDALVYSTFLGGTSLDEGQGIAADTNGYAYVVGFTDSPDFPVTTDAVQPLLNNTNAVLAAFDGFLAKLSPAGALDYSTYIGGFSNDYAYRVTLDAAGNPYVVGPSSSPDFLDVLQVPSGLHVDTSLTNGTTSLDAFLIKLDPTGLPVYTAAFGGSSTEIPWDVAVDPFGNAFVVGATSSTNFPSTNVFDLFRATNSGGNDVFVTVLNADASAAIYSAYFGGSDQDVGYGIAVDSESSAYIVGNTFSTNFPVTLGSLQPALGGVSDSFLAKIRLTDPTVNLAASNDTLVLTWPATAAEFMLESSSGLGPRATWATVTQRPSLAAGRYAVTLPATNSAALFRLRRP